MTVVFGNGRVCDDLNQIYCHLTFGMTGLTPRLRDKCIHETYQLTNEDGPAFPPDFVFVKDLNAIA